MYVYTAHSFSGKKGALALLEQWLQTIVCHLAVPEDLDTL